MHRRDKVDAEGAKEKQRPAAANGDAAQSLVTIPFFEENSASEKRERNEIQDERLSGRTEILKRELTEQCQADYGHDHAEDGEPAGAEEFFDGRDGFHALFKCWLWRRCA